MEAEISQKTPLFISDLFHSFSKSQDSVPTEQKGKLRPPKEGRKIKAELANLLHLLFQKIQKKLLKGPLSWEWSSWNGVERGLLTSGQDLRGIGYRSQGKQRASSILVPPPPLTPYQARHTAGSCLQEPPTTALIIVSAASGGWDAKLGEC